MACVACGGDSTAPDALPETGGSLVNDDQDNIGQPRELVVTEDGTRKKSVFQCFCESLYRSTLLIYHFTDQNAVVTITFDNKASTFPSTGTIHLFDQSASAESIARWINNQHSDGLYIDRAIPVSEVSISNEDITITSSAYQESVTGYHGDEYESYRVEFTVANQLATDLFFLNGFSDHTEVFLQTKGPDL